MLNLLIFANRIICYLLQHYIRLGATYHTHYQWSVCESKRIVLEISVAMCCGGDAHGEIYLLRLGKTALHAM